MACKSLDLSIIFYFDRNEVYPEDSPITKLPAMKSGHYLYETSNQFTQSAVAEGITVGDYDVEM